MKKSIQYSIIGGIAAVMFVGGFFVYPMTDTQNNNLSQSLALGGYGVVEAYHADGTLFYEWEGHNLIFDLTKSAISACLSGVDVTPNFGRYTCTEMIRFMSLIDTTQGITIAIEPVIQTLLPVGCLADAGSPQGVCLGWEVRATFDFTDLSCTTNIDCPIFNAIVTLANNDIPPIAFNSISPTPQQITPGDIIVVRISFNLS